MRDQMTSELTQGDNAHSQQRIVSQPEFYCDSLVKIIKADCLPYDEQWLHEPDDGRGWKCPICKYGGSANNSANRFCANCHTHR